MKRVISLLLALTVFFASLTFASVSVSAANTADSLVSIAEGELGNTNYSKYSSYSNAWCADFVSWCARQAGVDSIPSTASCYAMYNGMIANGCQEVSSPQRGDIVFFYCNSCSGTSNIWCHVGIMVDSSTSIDGNYSGKVSYDRSYSHYGSLGYKHSGSISKKYVRPNFENGHDPIGVIDGAQGGVGTVHLSGWAFDEDDINAQLNIHVYIGGPSGDANAEGHNQTWANQGRGDVNNVYGCGDYHGYNDIIPTSKTGTQTIYVYAINVSGGNNKLIGTTTVKISADTEKPVIENKYFDQVKSDGFWPCFTVKDNVGIKSVRVATWTRSDQSDLIWHDASNNGYGTYYVDVKRSDYSSIQNSIYHNHAYIYDYSGNVAFAGIDMDYRIKSDTGKNIPEGEYRIATAVNNDKYLDVAGGSTSSGANIQIYANYISPLQTYKLTYNNNGFYKIANTHSNCLVDVVGDTYLNNTNVAQSTENGGANQEWMFKPTGDNDGYYYIIARSNGLALDVTNALDQDGANVAVHTQNQTVAQKWKLRRVLNDEMVTVKDVTVKSETEEISPEITVTVDDEIITQSGNYQVEITTDLAAGKGTVTVTGIDNFCDSVTKEFNITVASALLGDADGNGDVEITDATLIQRRLSNIVVPYPDETLMNADVDGDDELTILDATFIQRHIARITTPYPIGEVIS